MGTSHRSLTLFDCYFHISNDGPHTEVSQSFITNEKYLELSYIRLLKKYLWYTGFWPGEALGEYIPLYIKWHRIQIVVQNVIGFVGQAWYIVENFTQMPFVVAGLLYIVASLTVLMAAKCSLTNFKGYQEIVRKLLQEFHLIHHSRGGAYEKKIIAKVDKISHYCTVYHMAIIFFVVLTFNGIPIFNSYKAGAFRGRNLSGMKLELAIYFRYPGFECLDYFYLLSFLNIYFTYIGAVAMFAIDAIVSAMIFQIIGHILILKHDIENLPEPKRESVVVFPQTGYEGYRGERVRLRLYDDEENKYIHDVLVGIINHHKYILGYVNEVSGFFGPTVGLNYMFHLVAGCVLLLECIRCDQDVLLRNLTLVAVSLVNLAVHSVTFEIVGSYSEQLIDAVYSMPWESMDISNQKCMKLFLSRVQTPIRVTTMGVIPVGIQTMGAILRTSCTYCTFLVTVDEG